MSGRSLLRWVRPFIGTGLASALLACNAILDYETPYLAENDGASNPVYDATGQGGADSSGSDGAGGTTGTSGGASGRDGAPNAGGANHGGGDGAPLVDAPDSTGGTAGNGGGGANTGNAGAAGAGGSASGQAGTAGTSGAAGAAGYAGSIAEGGIVDGPLGNDDVTSDAKDEIVGPTCTNDAQCSAPRSYCQTSLGRCVACLANAHCPTNARLCSAEYTCIQCETSADCGGNTPYCLAATHTCVRCLSNVHCSDAGDVCNATTNVCGCAAGLTLCKPGARGGGDGAVGCYDTQKDLAHCGGCNTMCNANQICSAGNCIVVEGGAQSG